MKIRNIEKWKKEIENAYTYDYHCTELAATGKTDKDCDIAYERKMHHYDEISYNHNSYEIVGLYDVLEIEKDGMKIYLSIESDNITIYADNKSYYKYMSSIYYDWFANRLSFIVYLTNMINASLKENR